MQVDLDDADQVLLLHLLWEARQNTARSYSTSTAEAMSGAFGLLDLLDGVAAKLGGQVGADGYGIEDRLA